MNVVRLPQPDYLVAIEDHGPAGFALFGVLLDGSRELLECTNDPDRCREVVSYWRDQGCRLAADALVHRRLRLAA